MIRRMGGEGAQSKGSLSGVPTNPEAPRAPRAEPGELHGGQILAGRYEIRGLIGAGGMGSVYRAFDGELSEDVALKVLRPDRLAGEASVERFRREAKLARRIGHPNVCRVFELHEVDGLRFITMEWIEGRSLRALLRQGRLSHARALDVLAQIASGVAAAHELGIVHRDLKPENILLCQDGRVKVADFGLALGRSGDGATTAGAGTPQYMSPEQLQGGAVSPASDVFALGIIGHELFTGRSPFGDGPPAVITSAILRDPPLELDVPGLDPEVLGPLAATLARALEKEPRARFIEAGLLHRELVSIKSIQDASMSRSSSPAQAGEQPIGAASSPPPPGRAAPSSGASHSQATSGPIESKDSPASGPLSPRPRPPSRAARYALPAIALIAAAGVAIAGVRFLRDKPVSIPAGAAPDAGARDIPLEAEVTILPFKDKTGEKDWQGLAVISEDAISSALSGVRGVKVADNSEQAERAEWTLHGAVQRVGPNVHVIVGFKRNGRPFGLEADVVGTPPGSSKDPWKELGERLRQWVKDEGPLLVREHRLRARAIRETVSEEARSKLLAYYEDRPALQKNLALRRDRIEKILAIDPGYLSARLERAEILAQLAVDPRGVEDAIAEVGAVLSAAPGEPRALTQQCRYRRYLITFDPEPSDAAVEAAEESCDRALDADVDSAVVPLTLAKLADKRCATATAMSDLGIALQRDRARAGEILPLMAALALESGKLLEADRYTSQLVALQEEEDRLEEKALSRRAGVDPVQGAYLLRGGVLLRAGKMGEARAAFEAELERRRPGYGAEETEAAALYGLLRAGGPAGALAPDLSRRLHDIEHARRTSIEIEGFAGEIAKTSPEDALVWLDRLPRSGSCSAAIVRASIHSRLGDRAAVAQDLAACKPSRKWERDCVEKLRGPPKR